MGRKKSKSRIKNVAWPWNDIPADVPDKLHIINKVISAFADELVTKFDIDNTERLGQMVNGFVDSLDFSDRYTEEFFSPLNSFWEELVATFDIKDLDNLEGVVVDFANALLELEDIWKDLDDDTSDPGHTGIEGTSILLYCLKSPRESFVQVLTEHRWDETDGDFTCHIESIGHQLCDRSCWRDR